MMDGSTIRADEYYERCVLCRRDMPIRVSDDLGTRLYYVEGCGQLCPNCYAALQGSPERVTSRVEFGRMRRQSLRLRLRQTH